MTKTWMGFAALAMAACTGTGANERSDAKLTDIEWTDQISGTTTIGQVDIGYADDHVKDMAFTQNGMNGGRMDFTYGDGKIKTIGMTDADGDQATQTWSYAQDRLSAMVWSVPQLLTYEQKFEYDDASGGRARRMTSTTTFAGAQPSSAVETFDYDDQGRLEKTTTVEGSTSTSSEMRYDEQGRIERMTDTAGTTFTENEVSYDDRGRVSLVETTGGNRYEVSYDDAGRIEEILFLAPSNSEQLTVRYSYGDGAVSGVSFAPMLPVSALVDLRGESFDQADFLAMPAPTALGDVPSPTPQSTCSHDVCVIGGALPSDCDACAADVCAADSYCCTSSWDSSCVSEVASYCGFSC